MIASRKFKVGDRVRVVCGILISVGPGVVTARLPHGYLAIRLDHCTSTVEVPEANVDWPLDKPKPVCDTPPA